MHYPRCDWSSGLEVLVILKLARMDRNGLHHISLPSRIAVGDTITISFGSHPKEFGLSVALVLGSIVWLVRRARSRFAVARPPAEQRFLAIRL